jgi:hypothetical protein
LPPLFASVVALLFLALFAEAARAARFLVPCGTQRSAGLNTPRPLVFRLANEGDCRFRLQLFDPSGDRVLNVLVLPGETQDFATANVLALTAIIDAALEPGVIGAVVRVRRMRNGEVVRVPAGVVGIPCDGTARIIYTCDDETDCPSVTYEIGVGSGLCWATLSIHRVRDVSTEIVVFPNVSYTYTGRFSSISIRASDRPPETYAFHYTRNP